MISHHKQTLISLFEKCYKIYSKPQESAKECLEVQEVLIQKISYIERKIRERRREIKALKSELGGREVRLSKDDARKAKDKIKRCQYQIDEYQDLIMIYRDVGDALAFSYIDRWDIKPLSIKEAPGTLSGKSGSRLERKILRKTFSLGHIVLLNDITNCLRYGDITVPKNGKFMVIEAKSGKHQTERDVRQAAEANKLLNFLVTDNTDNLYKQDGIFQRVGFGEEEKHYRDKVKELIFEAIKNETSVAEVENGLFYIVSTHFKPEVASDLFKKCVGRPLAGLITRSNTGKAYFPILLTIQDSELAYRFYNGQISIVTILDLGVIENKLRSHNLNFHFIENDEDWMAEITKNETPIMKIGRPLWHRLYSEFISLDWFINEIILHLVKSLVLYPE